MKNISHKKTLSTCAVHIHVDPPLIPLIKRRLDLKTERDYVKLNIIRTLHQKNPDMYEFKIDFFDNGYIEESLLFV